MFSCSAAVTTVCTSLVLLLVAPKYTGETVGLYMTTKRLVLDTTISGLWRPGVHVCGELLVSSFRTFSSPTSFPSCSVRALALMTRI